MKKLTKKRLKAIKEHLDFIQFQYDREGYISTNTADELIDYAKYLIERVEQLQQENEQLNNLVKIKESHEQQANNMVYLLEQQLQQAQAKVKELQDKLERCEAGYHYFNKTCDYWRGKAKRYEIALKNIAKDSLTMSDNFYNKYYELREIDRLALEGES
jgi:molecular chaperone GrpE (heat shock protein)